MGSLMVWVWAEAVVYRLTYKTHEGGRTVLPREGRIASEIGRLPWLRGHPETMWWCRLQGSNPIPAIPPQFPDGNKRVENVTVT
jgi:hypothetical protein